AVSEWAVAAEYAIKATDKLTITPAAEYLGNVGPRGLDGAIYGAGISPNADFSSNDAWTAGLTVDYKIT
ncbi:porin, partial [Agrobacterium rosae]